MDMFFFIVWSQLTSAQDISSKISTRTPSSEFADTSRNEIKPTVVVDCKNHPISDNPDSQGACWHFVTPEEYPLAKAVGQIVINGKPGCTATVIRPSACADKTAKVQVLTNGHCAARGGAASVKFGVFKDKAPKQQRDIGGNFIYQTQNGTDVGILELDISYDKLANYGITATTLATAVPSENLYSLTIPLEGVANPQDKVMRVSPYCQVDRTLNFVDSWRYYEHSLVLKNCPATGGSSGSGLFNQAGELVGMIWGGTRFKPPAPPLTCQRDSCGYDGKSEPFRHEGQYAVDVTSFNSCYSGCEINIDNVKCPLPNPKSDISLGLRQENWLDDLTKPFSISYDPNSFNDFMIKVCQPNTTCNCHDETGYQRRNGPPPNRVNNLNEVSLKPSDYMAKGLPTRATPGGEPKYQSLCVRGVKSSGKLDELKNVTTLPLYLFSQPPLRPPGRGKKSRNQIH